LQGRFHPSVLPLFHQIKSINKFMSTGKIALITGGSRGLGKNMAIALAKKNNHVIITYNSRHEEAAAVVTEIEKLGQKAVAVQLDAGNVRSFDGFVAEIKTALQQNFGTDTFDFLVNNAGVGLSTVIGSTSEEDFDTLTNIHFKGVYFLTQKLLPMMNDGGRILNLSSGLARFSMPGYAVYGALKGAMEVMTRYMALELGARKIGVNIVAPGAIETDFGGGHVRDNADLNKMIANSTALGRVGLPDDIGGVVAFLCSEEGGWINGQRIEVAGGINL
jgi:NAD(P)-dependent dehydrogenase (short-subunit alcohol dehydrogenase family)